MCINGVSNMLNAIKDSIFVAGDRKVDVLPFTPNE